MSDEVNAICVQHGLLHMVRVHIHTGARTTPDVWFFGLFPHLQGAQTLSRFRHEQPVSVRLLLNFKMAQTFISLFELNFFQKFVFEL
jgi:hypothetical protein